MESILPFTRKIFPVAPAATQPQSIMDPMLHSWQGVLLYKGVTLQTYLLLLWPNMFWFRQSKTHCSKRLQASQCFFFFIVHNFVLRSFFVATLPCRSLLFKVCCIVVLWTARPALAAVFCSTFAVMCGFFWACLTRSAILLYNLHEGLMLNSLSFEFRLPTFFHSTVFHCHFIQNCYYSHLLESQICKSPVALWFWL